MNVKIPSHEIAASPYSVKKSTRPDDNEDTESGSQEDESPVDACFEGATVILGYAGPFVRWNHRQEAADIHVQVGKSVFYRYANRSLQMDWQSIAGITSCLYSVHPAQALKATAGQERQALTLSQFYFANRPKLKFKFRSKSIPDVTKFQIDPCLNGV